MSATVPAVLKELHRLRRLLRDLQAEIDLGPRVQKAQEKQLEAAREAHADAHAIIGKLKLKIRDDEGTLKQVNVQLAKFEKQLEDTGSSKEFEGKQSEIRHAKEKIAALEEVVMATMEELEARTAALPQADIDWAAAQKQFADDQHDGRERLDRLNEEKARTETLLTETEGQLPADVKPLYDRLVKRHGAESLAGVVGKVCQNCRTGMTEQQRFDLVAGKFMCCANCGRGLYIAG